MASTRPAWNTFPKRKDYVDERDWEIAALKWQILALEADKADLSNELREMGRRYSGFINRAYSELGERGYHGAV